MTNRILIIGNGFDIYHGFPTKYNDFLNFIQNLNDYYENNKDTIGEITENTIFSVPINQLLSVDKNKIDCNDTIVFDINENNYKILYSKNNFWIKHFLNIKNELDENWIDFEKEIGRVLIEMKSFVYDTLMDFLTNYQLSVNDERVKPFFDILDVIDTETLKKRGVTDIRDTQLRPDLKHFFAKEDNIRSLETSYLEYFREELDELKGYLFIYMKDVISKLNTKVCSKQIRELGDVNLLSFNYTDFYPKIYPTVFEGNKQHIHGDLENIGIVLGMGNDERVENRVGYLFFQKYFQRMQNKIRFSYKKWIEELITIDSTPYEAFVAGHSLDDIDMDLLEFFFTKPEIERVTIFYYSQNDYEGKIINLIKHFKKDLLEEMIGSDKVVFEEWDSPIVKD